MSDWNYVPDRGLKRAATPRVLETRFGDGYSQRTKAGINNLSETWDLSYNNKTHTTLDAMRSFLETKAGVTAFTWTPPDQAEIKVICRQWNISTVLHTGTASTSFGSANVVFERVYE